MSDWLERTVVPLIAHFLVSVDLQAQAIPYFAERFQLTWFLILASIVSFFACICLLMVSPGHTYVNNLYLLFGYALETSFDVIRHYPFCCRIDPDILDSKTLHLEDQLQCLVE